MIDTLNIQALDALSSHIAILDSTGSIVYVNAAWRQFARENHCCDPEAARGSNYLEVCQRAAAAQDALAKDALEGINKVICGEVERYVQRYPCHGPRVEHWFQMTVGRTRLGGEVIISHDDITDCVRAERQRKLSERKLFGEGLQPSLTAASRADAFPATELEHELRTPLNAILGFSEIIRDRMFGDDPMRYSCYAGDIYRAGSRLLSVVEDVLKLQEMGELEETSFELETRLIEHVAAFMPQAEN